MRATLVFSFAALCICFAVSGTTRSQDGASSGRIKANPESNLQEDAALQARVDAFAKAYNAGDAKAVAALFTPEAELIDEEDNVIQSRENIEAAMAQFFEENKGAQIAVEVASRRKVSTDTIVEDGRTKVTYKDSDTVAHNKYMVVLVKRDGAWLMASVREMEHREFSIHERLKALEWMVGEWVDEGGDAAVHSVTKWSPDGNYLLREYTVKHRGKSVVSGHHRIGWDPITNRIKGWNFDADGGHGESYWTQDGDRWVVKANGVTADGLVGSATYVLTLEGPNKLSFKVYDRVVGGQVDPNMEVSMVRKAPPPK